MSIKLSEITSNRTTPVGTVKTSVKDSINGWIVCDGKSIGKVDSGADLEGNTYKALYELLWNLDGLSETEGDPFVFSDLLLNKGVNAEADWNANKTITIDFAANELFVRQKGSGTTLGGYQDNATAVNGLVTNSDAHSHLGGKYFKEAHDAVYGTGGTSANKYAVSDSADSGDVFRTYTSSDTHNHTMTGNPETRPKNVALNYFIKF